MRKDGDELVPSLDGTVEFTDEPFTLLPRPMLHHQSGYSRRHASKEQLVLLGEVHCGLRSHVGNSDHLAVEDERGTVEHT